MGHSKIIAADTAGIERASRALQAGELVGLPTETVYGLAANALSDEAVASIYAAKGRPSFNPLIVHVGGADDATQYAEVSELAAKLMAAFWPGPLTIVLPRRNACKLSPIVSAGLGTVALRVPGHRVAQALLKACGLPLAAPSANVSGSISPTRADHVAEGLGDKVACVLEGGACDVGLESTIVGVEGDQIILLRPGSISATQLEHATGVVPKKKQDGGISAPGQMSSHYAPEHQVRTSAFHADENEVMIGFGAVEGDFNLSNAGNVVEAAKNLFEMLRAADKLATDQGKLSIAIAPIPFEGIGIAINDRIERAAAPK